MSTRSNSPDDQWRGRRYICLVRQSSDADGATSTEAQLQWLHSEGDRRGMIRVDDVVLEGVPDRGKCARRETWTPGFSFTCGSIPTNIVRLHRAIGFVVPSFTKTASSLRGLPPSYLFWCISNGGTAMRTVSLGRS